MGFNKDIIICGDIHGLWGYLNTLINKKKPSIILQVGDWGHWVGKKISSRTVNGMRISGFDPMGVKAKDTEIFWCDGNHENHNDLDLRTSTPCEVMPNVFYMRRGSIMTLPDGRVVLFMGGAASIDKHLRTPGVDWFPQEMLSFSELYKLEERGIDKIDIVISHTAPCEFNNLLNKKKIYGDYKYKFFDSSQEVLSAILEMFKPSLWYFGHFHVSQKGIYKNTKWQCMHMAPFENWWTYLDK